MLRGEIRVVNLAPVVGSEADKRRPAVIVSDDDATGNLVPFRDSSGEKDGVRRVRVLRVSRPEGVDLAMSPHLALSPRPNFVVVPA